MARVGLECSTLDALNNFSKIIKKEKERRKKKNVDVVH
jgi:hypothetical protein